MATPSVTTINQTNTTTLPQWYTDYMSGIAARGEALLGTDAEQRVNDTLRVPAGQTRYQIFVMCMPAMPAAPR